MKDEKSPGSLLLKHCPFCGGAASFEQIANAGHPNHLRWSIGCGDEDCIGYQSLATFARKLDAVKAWNRRAASDDASD